MDVNYFSSSEQNCPCCHEGALNRGFLAYLNSVRQSYEHPIQLTSAFRCPEWNVSVCGVKQSPHLVGKAVDIALPNPRYLPDLLSLLFCHAGSLDPDDEELLEGEEDDDYFGVTVVLYRNHLHVAVNKSGINEMHIPDLGC